MMEPKWLPWQQSVLDDLHGSHGEYVIQAPRQNGKTEVLLWDALLSALTANGRVLVVSQDVRMSRHNMDRIRKWLDGHEEMYRATLTNGQEQIDIRGCGRIYFRSFRQRGGSGLQCDNVYVDGCDDMTADQRCMLMGVYPQRVVYGCVLPQAQSPLRDAEGGVFYCYDGRDSCSKRAWEIANPAAGSLISWGHAVRMQQLLTEEEYRREVLGTGPFMPGCHDAERARILL